MPTSRIKLLNWTAKDIELLKNIMDKIDLNWIEEEITNE